MAQSRTAMNTTEDGTEPLGEAPELTGHSRRDPNEFVHQAVTAIADGEHRTVWVPAQTTPCPHLVITPAVGWSDGRLRFRGALALTHTLTGAPLVQSMSAAGLEKLADALKGFDWVFSARDHFAKPENAALAGAVRAVIRDWQTDEGFSGPVVLWGDDKDKRAAREREPATTLLREQLDWWSQQYKSGHDRDLMNQNRDAWYEAISSSVNGWGMTYLLAVLQRIAPDVADIAARRLVAEFDAGDGLGEWIFQWSQELADGKPLTLSGIPDADPLAQFGVSA
jgi:hypothetical protein